MRNKPQKEAMKTVTATFAFPNREAMNNGLIKMLDLFGASFIGCKTNDATAADREAYKGRVKFVRGLEQTSRHH
jgi:hypothetical protein